MMHGIQGRQNAQAQPHNVTQTQTPAQVKNSDVTNLCMWAVVVALSVVSHKNWASEAGYYLFRSGYCNSITTCGLRRLGARVALLLITCHLCSERTSCTEKRIE